MRFHAALVLLMTLAAVYAEDKKSPSKPPTKEPPTKEPPTKGGGKGDPIMTGFDGRTFEFLGKSGGIYSVISEKSHQLSMKLKEARQWDHNGTVMTALALRYQEHSIILENVGNGMMVTLDGEKVVLREGETEVEHILGMASGELQLLWQLHRPDFGNTVEVSTDMLNLVVWVTPAGTRDEGGVVQGSYLNFDVSLLASPAHNAMEGIVGRSFNLATSEEDDFKFHGVEADFEMTSFFDDAHPKCLLGKSGGVSRARKLIESGIHVSFPLKAGFHK